MAQTITKGIDALLKEARAEVTAIPTEAAMALVDSPDHVLVDLRDIRELQRAGKIPGAFSCPRGMLEFWIDPDSPYFKPIFGEDKQFVLQCASGWRSALSCKTLNDMGFDASHLREGFSTWEAQGGPVEHMA